jgi:hypothetical protein
MVPNLPELSETHQKWVWQLENDYVDMPMGMADALVRLWLKRPEFFTQENLANMKNTDDVPVLEKTVGSAHIATPEEIQAIEQKLIEHQKRGELVQNTSIEEVPGDIP